MSHTYMKMPSLSKVEWDALVSEAMELPDSTGIVGTADFEETPSESDREGAEERDQELFSIPSFASGKMITSPIILGSILASTVSRYHGITVSRLGRSSPH